MGVMSEEAAFKKLGESLRALERSGGRSRYLDDARSAGHLAMNGEGRTHRADELLGPRAETNDEGSGLGIPEFPRLFEPSGHVPSEGSMFGMQGFPEVPDKPPHFH